MKAEIYEKLTKDEKIEEWNVNYPNEVLYLENIIGEILKIKCMNICSYIYMFSLIFILPLLIP